MSETKKVTEYQKKDKGFVTNENSQLLDEVTQIENPEHKDRVRQLGVDLYEDRRKLRERPEYEPVVSTLIPPAKYVYGEDIIPLPDKVGVSFKQKLAIKFYKAINRSKTLQKIYQASKRWRKNGSK